MRLRDVTAVTDRSYDEFDGHFENHIFEGTYRCCRFSGVFINCSFVDAEFFDCEMTGTFERCEWSASNGPW